MEYDQKLLAHSLESIRRGVNDSRATRASYLQSFQNEILLIPSRMCLYDSSLVIA